jgi:UDP-perosamine 4-acetyltransferase
MTKPVIIIGAGGHAKVVIDTLKKCDMKILGAVDTNSSRHGTNILGIPVLGTDDIVATHKPDSILLANGVGSTSDTALRQKIFKRFKEQGYTFTTLIHPTAIIAEDVKISEGSQVMAGTVLQPGIRMGVNCIINTSASIDHDCIIGDHVHIAPGATLSGSIRIEDLVHVGTGASIIHQINIGRQSIIGAGAVVVHSVGAHKTVIGNPAKAI